LRTLPKWSLWISLGTGLIGDLITTEELEQRALEVVKKIEDELEAELQAGWSRTCTERLEAGLCRLTHFPPKR